MATDPSLAFAEIFLRSLGMGDQRRSQSFDMAMQNERLGLLARQVAGEESSRQSQLERERMLQGAREDLIGAVDSVTNFQQENPRPGMPEDVAGPPAPAAIEDSIGNAIAGLRRAGINLSALDPQFDPVKTLGLAGISDMEQALRVGLGLDLSAGQQTQADLAQDRLDLDRSIADVQAEISRGNLDLNKSRFSAEQKLIKTQFLTALRKDFGSGLDWTEVDMSNPTWADINRMVSKFSGTTMEEDELLYRIGTAQLQSATQIAVAKLQAGTQLSAARMQALASARGMTVEAYKALIDQQKTQMQTFSNMLQHSEVIKEAWGEDEAKRLLTWGMGAMNDLTRQNIALGLTDPRSAYFFEGPRSSGFMGHDILGTNLGSVHQITPEELQEADKAMQKGDLRPSEFIRMTTPGGSFQGNDFDPAAGGPVAAALAELHGATTGAGRVPLVAPNPGGGGAAGGVKASSSRGVPETPDGVIGGVSREAPLDLTNGKTFDPVEGNSIILDRPDHPELEGQTISTERLLRSIHRGTPDDLARLALDTMIDRMGMDPEQAGMVANRMLQLGSDPSTGEYEARFMLVEQILKKGNPALYSLYKDFLKSERKLDDARRKRQKDERGLLEEVGVKLPHKPLPLSPGLGLEGPRHGAKTKF